MKLRRTKKCASFFGPHCIGLLLLSTALHRWLCFTDKTKTKTKLVRKAPSFCFEFTIIRPKFAPRFAARTLLAPMRVTINQCTVIALLASERLLLMRVNCCQFHVSLVTRHASHAMPAVLRAEYSSLTPDRLIGLLSLAVL